ncbi:MAG: amidohydrolase family protein, partial [Pseudomonadota bacterium]
MTSSETRSRRRFLAGAGALATGVAVGPTLGAAPKADLVLTDGELITLDPSRPRAQALAVSGGLILATGSNADMLALAGPEARVISAGGRTVVPGLNDSHQHPTRAGRFYALELRWDGLSSLQQGLAMIDAQAKRTPEGHWVRVIGGWSPYQFRERRMPTPAELTAASPN